MRKRLSFIISVPLNLVFEPGCGHKVGGLIKYQNLCEIIEFRFTTRSGGVTVPKNKSFHPPSKHYAFTFPLVLFFNFLRSFEIYISRLFIPLNS